jgi:3-oxoadipate enol-lactonase
MNKLSQSQIPFGQDHVPGAPRIGFQWFGAGQPIIFLHGVGGWRGNWFDQLLFFGQTHRAVAWDARGYGLSDDYDGPVHMRDFSADLLRLVDYLHCDRVHLVGLSMGGFIAQDFYARYPLRVRSLTLADTAISLESVHGREFVERFRMSREEPLRAGKRMSDLAPDLAAALVTGGRASPSYPAAIESMAVQRTESYLKAVAAVTTFENPLSLSSVQVPTLVMVGALDALTPPSASLRLSQGIANARYAELAGAGHLSNIEKPTEFNAVLASFLSDIKENP